jgi:hypothetical protein
MDGLAEDNVNWRALILVVWRVWVLLRHYMVHGSTNYNYHINECNLR